MIFTTFNCINCQCNARQKEYQAQGMDDVLRKPLSIEELTACLVEYFGHGVSLCLETPTTHQITQDATHFDVKMLSELVEMLGTDFVLKNLALFKETMPEYMQALMTAYSVYQQDESQKADVLSCAHKIKGAAASVGLKRIQQIAAQAQDPEQGEWTENIHDWVQQLAQYWLLDVEALERYLNKSV